MDTKNRRMKRKMHREDGQSKERGIWDLVSHHNPRDEGTKKVNAESYHIISDCIVSHL